MEKIIELWPILVGLIASLIVIIFGIYQFAKKPRK